jgi:Protein of unknown function (DUF2950)
MDFVVKGVMISGFAPGRGVVTVRRHRREPYCHHDGVAYEKDVGPTITDEFKKMERFNHDKTWSTIKDQ